jgi:DNA polymerase
MIHRALTHAYSKHQEDTHPALVRLREGDGRFVGGRGPAPCRVMIVGEAPGAQEVVSGKPFCGPAGTVLDGWLMLAGLFRDECFITNAVKYRPADRYGHNRTPRLPELQASRLVLATEATVVNPQWIVALGSSAVKALWSDRNGAPAPKMSDAHGQVFLRHGRQVFVMYHPAAVLHDESKLDTGLADAREFGRLLG